MSESATFYQVALKFPQSVAAEVAKTLAEIGAITNLSFATDDGLFNKQIVCIISYPTDKQDTVTAKFHKYIKS